MYNVILSEPKANRRIFYLATGEDPSTTLRFAQDDKRKAVHD